MPKGKASSRSEYSLSLAHKYEIKPFLISSRKKITRDTLEHGLASDMPILESLLLETDSISSTLVKCDFDFNDLKPFPPLLLFYWNPWEAGTFLTGKYSDTVLMLIIHPVWIYHSRDVLLSSITRVF